MLDNTLNQPSKFRTKNWVEINDHSRGTHKTNSQIKSKTSILKSSSCDYSDACILVSRTIIVAGVEADNVTRATNRNNKETIFKNCARLPTG